MSRHTLSQADLQNGELGPGWPSTYEQYSAEAQAEPGEEPRQAHKRLRAPNAAGSVASRTSLTTRGSFRSQPFMGRPLPVGGRPLPGRRESMRLFSVPHCVLPTISSPSSHHSLPQQGIPSVLAAIFSLSSRERGRSAQLDLLPNQGERLDASLTISSQALQRGQLGTQSWLLG